MSEAETELDRDIIELDASDGAANASAEARNFVAVSMAWPKPWSPCSCDGRMMEMSFSSFSLEGNKYYSACSCSSRKVGRNEYYGFPSNFQFPLILEFQIQMKKSDP